jgi:hypothetical protein
MRSTDKRKGVYAGGTTVKIDSRVRREKGEISP